MIKPASSLYAINHVDLGKQIANHIEKGCQLAPNHPLVFFRADDIAVPSRRFQQLVGCFQKHQLPLCLATVPAWLTQKRLSELRRLTGENNDQWYWHQHGRIHRNFEPDGKKQEFGPARTKSEIQTSLIQGKQRLEHLLDKDFHPVFTPPWNRCGVDTLVSLADLNYRAISRSKGAQPETIDSLPDYQVNVDLHTRKEATPQLALDNFLKEIELGVGSGLCGIMIHHQRMNNAALLLLDIILGLIKNNRKLIPVHFGDLLTGK